MMGTPLSIHLLVANCLIKNVTVCLKLLEPLNPFVLRETMERKPARISSIHAQHRLRIDVKEVDCGGEFNRPHRENHLWRNLCSRPRLLKCLA
jgi:hypothetical protein